MEKQMTLRECRELINQAYVDNYMDRMDQRVWLAGIGLEPKDTLYYSGEEMRLILRKMQEQRMVSN